MKKPISTSREIVNIQEKIKILHKKAQDCLYDEILLMNFDENQHLSRYEQSIKLVDESIKLDPALVKSYEFKAYICILSGRKNQAIKSLEIMLELDPDNKNAKEFHEALIIE
jgi:tetratricopeptide (TPR) repeat protein